MPVVPHHEHRVATSGRARHCGIDASYGCDVCQDVCPHNKLPNAGTIEEFVPSERLMELGLDDVATMTPSAFRSLFRNSAVRRARLEGLRRNALHAK